MGVEPGAELFEWREPKASQKAGFGKWKNPKSPYDVFMEAQGISIHRDIGVHKVRTCRWLETAGRTGHRHPTSGDGSLWGMYVVEVPGKGAESRATSV
jgi:hypothetical protein